MATRQPRLCHALLLGARQRPLSCVFEEMTTHGGKKQEVGTTIANGFVEAASPCAKAHTANIFEKRGLERLLPLLLLPPPPPPARHLARCRHHQHHHADCFHYHATTVVTTTNYHTVTPVVATTTTTTPTAATTTPLPL